MSKKVNNQATTATIEAVVTTKRSLQSYFEEYPNASLRKLAAATDVNYGVLLKKSKDPIPGEAYDPDATNWAALEAKLTSKQVDWTTLDWAAMNEGPNRKGGAVVKDMSRFEVGMQVYLRRNATIPYEILYKTETHIVIMLVGTSEPQAWSNSTFLLNGPQFEPRAEKVEKDVAPASSADEASEEVAQG